MIATLRSPFLSIVIATVFSLSEATGAPIVSSKIEKQGDNYRYSYLISVGAEAESTVEFFTLIGAFGVNEVSAPDDWIGFPSSYPLDPDQFTVDWFTFAETNAISAKQTRGGFEISSRYAPGLLDYQVGAFDSSPITGRILGPVAEVPEPQTLNILGWALMSLACVILLRMRSRSRI
jgi:hypothetical protein